MVVANKQIRQASKDTVRDLLKLLERARRKASRLEAFGLVPQEVSTKVLGYILTIREELLAQIGERE